MNFEQAQKLLHMHALGYLIKIEDGHFEDQPATDIYEATETDAADSGGEVKEGEVVYDSSVYTARPLRDVSVGYVKTYIPFDWQNVEVDYYNDVSLSDDLPF